jgi:transcriptional regulator with XRE-family HTH domain
VAGLRREEVAMLAGVSVDYYTRLERGNAHGASESVLEALASALHLDEAERAHLFDLVRAASPAARAQPARSGAVRPDRGAVDADGLNLLASWAATLEAAGSAPGQPGKAR